MSEKALVLAVLSDRALEDEVEKACGAEGAECILAADEETLGAALQEGEPSFILLDLGASTLDAAATIEHLKRNPATKRTPLVVFGNSLRADLLQDAKESGADLVLPRSAFNRQLSELIRHYTKR